MLPVHGVFTEISLPLPLVVMEPGRLIVSSSFRRYHCSSAPLSAGSTRNDHVPASSIRYVCAETVVVYNTTSRRLIVRKKVLFMMPELIRFEVSNFCCNSIAQGCSLCIRLHFEFINSLLIVFPARQ